MPGNVRWSAHELKHLRGAVSEGAYHAEIAEELGRTHKAVKAKCVELGLGHVYHGRRPNVDVRLTLIEMLDAGLSVRAAGRRLKRNNTLVRYWVSELVRNGVLVRTGGATNTCRYRTSETWRRSKPRPDAERNFGR